MDAERSAASLRENPRSLASSAAFSSAGRSGEVVIFVSSLLPLWEKVARTQSASDEGSASAERDPSPAHDTSYRVHPLPQGERVGRASRHDLIENLHRVIQP